MQSLETRTINADLTEPQRKVLVLALSFYFRIHTRNGLPCGLTKQEHDAIRDRMLKGQSTDQDLEVFRLMRHLTGAVKSIDGKGKNTFDRALARIKGVIGYVGEWSPEKARDEIRRILDPKPAEPIKDRPGDIITDPSDPTFRLGSPWGPDAARRTPQPDLSYNRLLRREPWQTAPTDGPWVRDGQRQEHGAPPLPAEQPFGSMAAALAGARDQPVHKLGPDGEQSFRFRAPLGPKCPTCMRLAVDCVGPCPPEAPAPVDTFAALSALYGEAQAEGLDMPELLWIMPDYPATTVAQAWSGLRAMAETGDERTRHYAQRALDIAKEQADPDVIRIQDMVRRRGFMFVLQQVLIPATGPKEANPLLWGIIEKAPGRK